VFPTNPTSDLLMSPACKEFNCHGDDVWGLDLFQVSISYALDCGVKGAAKQIEITDHSAVVELGSPHNRLDPVIMRMGPALGPMHARHHMRGSKLPRNAHFIHSARLPLAITKCSVDKSVLAVIESFERFRRIIHRKLMGSETSQGKFVE
jgi:hypothetical protein